MYETKHKFHKNWKGPILVVHCVLHFMLCPLF